MEATLFVARQTDGRSTFLVTDNHVFFRTFFLSRDAERILIKSSTIGGQRVEQIIALQEGFSLQLEMRQR